MDGCPIKGKDGEPLTAIETVTTTRRDFDWRAAMELLRRRFPAQWALRETNEMGALRVLAEAEWLPPEVMEAIAEKLADLAGAARAAIARASMAIPSALE